MPSHSSADTSTDDSLQGRLTGGGDAGDWVHTVNDGTGCDPDVVPNAAALMLSKGPAPATSAADVNVDDFVWNRLSSLSHPNSAHPRFRRPPRRRSDFARASFPASTVSQCRQFVTHAGADSCPFAPFEPKPPQCPGGLALSCHDDDLGTMPLRAVDPMFTSLHSQSQQLLRHWLTQDSSKPHSPGLADAKQTRQQTAGDCTINNRSSDETTSTTISASRAQQLGPAESDLTKMPPSSDSEDNQRTMTTAYQNPPLTIRQARRTSSFSSSQAVPAPGMETDTEPTESEPQHSVREYQKCVPQSADSSAVFLYRSNFDSTQTTAWPDDVQKAKIHYVPLSAVPSQDDGNYSDKCHPQQLSFTSPLHNTNLSWPQGRLPSEIYSEITRYLSRHDVKAMRLTCREFERYTSHTLFSDVVVPFNTEIYGMLETSVHGSNPLLRHSVLSDDTFSMGSRPMWKNDKADHIYTGQGINVYRGLGPHIQRYGMSFEVDEIALSNPPNKIAQEDQKSYWGVFPWPPAEYRRFSRTANLENAADETPKMKHAFSFLTRARELALSLDSGLGWLNGPDTSIRTQILSMPSPILHAANAEHDCLPRGQVRLWEILKSLHRISKTPLRYSCLRLAPFSFTELDFERLKEQYRGSSSDDELELSSKLLLRARESLLQRSTEMITPDVFEVYEEPPYLDNSTERRGLLYTAEQNTTSSQHKRARLTPSCLTTPQKEWLLETGWAQSAFLSSYMVAVIDNPVTFQHVHTLTFARISSRFLNMLERIDFWTSLPSLTNVTIKVLADWREIRKDVSGQVQLTAIPPSHALAAFHRLLTRTLAHFGNIKRLAVGWASGGEHAEGIYARNQHLLPAPILHPSFLDSSTTPALNGTVAGSFPHVEHLELINTWIVPADLVFFIKQHARLKLQRLMLDSVSLTATPSSNNVPNQGQQGPILTFLQWMTNNVAQAAQPSANGGTAHAQNSQTQTTNAQQITQLANAPGHPGTLPLQAVPQTAQVQVVVPGHNNLAAGRHGRYRKGSWPWVLNVLYPDRNSASSLDDDDDDDELNSNHVTAAAGSLRQIELRSCGYAKVTDLRFDNSHLEPAAPNILDAHFQSRHHALESCMMKSSDDLLGEIVPFIRYTEANCLRNVWDCALGWEDADKAEAATFDGAPPGGTGRFSGIIRKA